jgi:hypothetical protein
MECSFWVAVRVAVPVSFWVAIRTATPTRAEDPCTALVSTVPFSGRQGSGLCKRAARGSPRVGRGPNARSSLKERVWMPRPFWDPFWDPFWRPIWTGFPCATETPCTVRRFVVCSSARQPSGLRRCSEGGTVPMPGAPGRRRLAHAVDRWSHGRPAKPTGRRRGVEVWR